MSNFMHVIPRDFFNVAGLCKCYGRLAILLGETHGHSAAIEPDQVPYFDIVQDESSGGIAVRNVSFSIGGVRHYLQRSLNSRESWGLWVVGNDMDPDFEEVQVFDDQGDFTSEMLSLIRMEAESQGDHDA